MLIDTTCHMSKYQSSISRWQIYKVLSVELFWDGRRNDVRFAQKYPMAK